MVCSPIYGRKPTNQPTNHLRGLANQVHQHVLGPGRATQGQHHAVQLAKRRGKRWEFNGISMNSMGFQWEIMGFQWEIMGFQ